MNLLYRPPSDLLFRPTTDRDAAQRRRFGDLVDTEHGG